MLVKWKKIKKTKKIICLVAAVLTIMALCFPLLAESERILYFEADGPVELTVKAGTEEPNLPHTLRAVVALELEEEDVAAEQIQPSISASEPEQQAGEQSESSELEESASEPVESSGPEEPVSEPADSPEQEEPDSEPGESPEQEEPDNEPAELPEQEELDHEPAELPEQEELDHEPVASVESDSEPSVELVKAAGSKVQLMSIHEGQTTVFQSQQLFVPDEPGDTYGYQPADGGLYTYLDQYRTYGSLDGGAPAWYACDDTGNVTGVVMEIPVTWTSDDYDQNTPGTYIFTAQFSDYGYTGELPYALVTVAEGEVTVSPSISGVVWLDENSDGIRDVDETGIDGYPVALYAAGDLNTAVQETVTDPDGAYRFEGMAQGSYVVSVTSEIIDETEYLLPWSITNDNRFEMDEEAAASWSAPLELAEDTAISGMDAGMRLPMGIQLLDGAVIPVSNFDDLRDVVWPALSDGDTILIMNDMEFTRALTVTKNVTIKAAPEADSATLTSTGWRHFVVSGSNVTLTLDHVVLDGGGTVGGIDLETGSSLTLQGVRIQDCRAPGNYGGGINAKGGNTVLLDGSEVSGCAANYGGGIFIRNSGYLTVTNGSRIDENYTITTGTVGGGGGGIAAHGSTVVISEDSEVLNNRAGTGGAIFMQSGSLRVTGSGKIANNTVTGGGGGIYATSSVVVIENSEISGNTARIGGGVYMAYSTAITIDISKIFDNAATTSGGGLYSDNCTISAENSEFSGNEASSDGGGIYLNRGTATLLDSKISGNKAGSNGGGVTILGGASLVMNGGEISGNEATENGGGVQALNASSFSLTGGTISNNTAQVNGGGIYAGSSTVTVEGGEISDNTANDGGGIYAASSSAVTVDGGKVSDNTAANYGGGIYTADITKLSVSDAVTFSGNTASISAEPLPNMTANYPKIAATSSSIYNHPLNNYDIFTRVVTVHYVDGSGNFINGFSSAGYAAVYGAAFTLPPERIPAIPGYVYTGWQQGTSGAQQGSEAPVTLSNVTGDTTIYLRYARNNSVTVSNVVSGDYADKTRDFTFIVRFADGSGNPLTGTLAYTGSVISGSGAAAPSDGTLSLDSSGEATFALRHGQQIAIADIPADGKVWIETESVTGYTASWSDSAPSIGTGVSTGELTMTGTDRTIAFTNTYDDIVATGIRTDGTGPALLLALLAGVPLLLLTAGLVRRRRQKGVMN